MKILGDTITGNVPDYMQHIYAPDSVLPWWAKYAAERFKEKIKKLKIKGIDLAGSITYEISKSGDTYTVSFFFNQYGRFVDMGVGKGVKIGDVKMLGSLRREIGEKNVTPRKPKKWYSKTKQGEVLKLYELLQINYQKDALDLIKDTLIKIVE